MIGEKCIGYEVIVLYVSELWQQVEARNVTLSVNCDSRWRLWVWHCVWTVTGRGCECDAVSEQWQQVEAVNVTVSVNCDRSRLWMWRCLTTRCLWWSHNSASLSYNDLSLLVNMSAHNSSNDLTAHGLTTSLSLLFVLTPRNSAEFCVESVCLSVFLSSCTSVKPHSQILPMFVYTACGRGSLFLWKHCSMLHTSGFVDYVIFVTWCDDILLFYHPVLTVLCCTAGGCSYSCVFAVVVYLSLAWCESGVVCGCVCVCVQWEFDWV